MIALIQPVKEQVVPDEGGPVWRQRLHEGLREPLPKEQPQVGERRLQKGEASVAAFLSRNQNKSMDWTLEREKEFVCAIFEPEPKT